MKISETNLFAESHSSHNIHCGVSSVCSLCAYLEFDIVQYSVYDHFKRTLHIPQSSSYVSI